MLDPLRVLKHRLKAAAGQYASPFVAMPEIFADPQTRFVIANQADAGGALKADGGVFTGTLPASVPIANTSTT